MRSLIVAAMLTLSTGAVAAQELPKGCSNTPEVIENVQRVFMHQAHSYSFLVSRGEKTAHLVSVYGTPDKSEYVVFVTDVPPEKPMWVNVFDCSSYIFVSRFIEIHVRSFENIEGGGWRRSHGKSSSYGTTIPVQ